MITSVLLVIAVTMASFGYDLATDGPEPPPAGLLFVHAHGFDTRYRTWGTSGSPIVLVPGTLETADSFAALSTTLGADHRVFAIDLTGTGYSAPSAPFDGDHLAAQLLAFLDAEHLTASDSPILVGHSSGAAVVGLAALRRPHSIRGLVFLDGDGLPAGLPSFARWLLPKPYRTTVLRLGLSSDWLIKQLYGSQCGPTCPDLSSTDVDTWRRPLRGRGFESMVDYMLAHGIPNMSAAEISRLKAVGTPKRVVVGADDRQMSAQDARDRRRDRCSTTSDDPRTPFDHDLVAGPDRGRDRGTRSLTQDAAPARRRWSPAWSRSLPTHSSRCTAG